MRWGLGLLLAGSLASGAMANPAESIRAFLLAGRDLAPSCSPERDALLATAARLAKVSFPSQGKFVLVNIPAGRLVAYEDGVPVLEMKTIIGKATHQTPVMSTRVTSVRLNPTWTVPWSIVREDGWLQRLRDEPEFFTRNRFELRDSQDRLVTIAEASENPSRVAKFIQAPGRYNALGDYRFNIASSDAIYLHDTRDRQDFYSGGPIARSHGCVRLEDPASFAKWLLDVDDDWLEAKMRDGSTRDFPVSEKIPVVMGYFTAWPTADQEIVVYDDVYGQDANSSGRGG